MSRKQELTLEWSNTLGRSQKNLSEFYSQIWRNVRPDGGLRVTPYGADILEKIGLKSWPVKIKNTSRSGHTVLNMDKHLDSPYFFDNRKNQLVVYSEELATQLYLYDGDLHAFLDAFQNRS